MRLYKWIFWTTLMMSITPAAFAGGVLLDNDLELIALDGKVVRSVSSTPKNLLSGQHQLLIQYKKRLRDRKGQMLDYKTPPLLMMVDTLPNEDIRIQAPVLNTKSQAELYFSKRSIWHVKHESGRVETVKFHALVEQEDLSKEELQRVLDDYNRRHGKDFFQADTTLDPANNELLKSIQLLFIQANREQQAEIKRWILKQ